MKLRCIHGFFIFEEQDAGELVRFCRNFGFSIESGDSYYTFEDLSDAPDYSIKAVPYLGVPALFSYAGPPWQVMRKNRLVYDFYKAEVVLLDSVLVPLDITSTSNYFFSKSLIVPGSIDRVGRRVTDFTADFDPDGMKFRYSEVLYDKTL